MDNQENTTSIRQVSTDMSCALSTSGALQAQAHPYTVRDSAAASLSVSRAHNKSSASPMGADTARPSLLMERGRAVQDVDADLL